MFKKRTVIVVGAGASHEYGLPVGRQLSENIVSTLEEIHKFARKEEYNRSAVQGFGMLSHNLDPPDLRQVAQFQAGLLHASSIDRFLKVHADNEIIQQIGKYAIVHEILRAEASSTLMLDANKNLRPHVSVSGSKPDWLSEIFLLMQEDVGRDNVADAFNNLTFACFNYDRCIEHFMYHAVKEFAMVPQDVARSAVSHLKIIHPYGSIGRLEWDIDGKGTAVPFGDLEAFRGVVQSAHRRIKTFNEEVTNPEELKDLKQALHESAQIVFVGFSFLDQNMDLLTSNLVCEAHVYATTYGQSDPDVAIIKRLIGRLLSGRGGGGDEQRVETFSKLTAGQFFRDWGRLLRD